MSYLIYYTGDGVEAAIAPGQFVNWKNGDIRWVAKESAEFYTSRPTLFETLLTPPMNYRSNKTYSTPGMRAVAYVDFNTGAAEAEASVTIDGVVYLEADTAVVANGVWTNGADAAASATSFAAAVNGDTRNGGSPFTAVVALNTEGVWLFADAPGEAGNVDITKVSAARVTVDAKAALGADPEFKRLCSIKHTVTTHQLLSTAIEIPLPFVPETYFVTAYSATGLVIRFTDLVTIQATPARMRIDTDGVTNLANTNVLHILLIGE